MKWTQYGEMMYADLSSQEIEEIANIGRLKAKRLGIKYISPDVKNRSIVIEGMTAQETRELAKDLSSFQPEFMEFIPTGLVYIVIKDHQNCLSYLQYLELKGFGYVDFNVEGYAPIRVTR